MFDQELMVFGSVKEKMEIITDYEKDDQLKGLRAMFYIFAAFTVILIAFFQGITVASAHTLILMVWVKQVSNEYKESLRSEQETIKDKFQAEQIKELKDRLDLIDPYSKDE